MFRAFSNFAIERKSKTLVTTILAANTEFMRKSSSVIKQLQPLKNISIQLSEITNPHIFHNHTQTHIHTFNCSVLIQKEYLAKDPFILQKEINIPHDAMTNQNLDLSEIVYLIWFYFSYNYLWRLWCEHIS